MDPLKHQSGSIDVTRMVTNFDAGSGEYELVLATDSPNPCIGVFRIKLNLFNTDVGTTEPDPSFFSDLLNEVALAAPERVITPTGTRFRLAAWRAGHRVYTNSLKGTGNPEGITLFRSSVLALSSLVAEDMIAYADTVSPALARARAGFPHAEVSGQRILLRHWGLPEVGLPSLPVPVSDMRPRPFLRTVGRPDAESVSGAGACRKVPCRPLGFVERCDPWGAARLRIQGLGSRGRLDLQLPRALRGRPAVGDATLAHGTRAASPRRAVCQQSTLPRRVTPVQVGSRFAVVLVALRVPGLDQR